MDQAQERSVPVDGPKLWADRIAVASTEERFLDLMGERAVSLSTLQRAENGRFVQLQKLKAIAETIGQPVEKYVRNESIIAQGTTCDVSGVWQGHYIEPDVTLNPCLVSLSMTIIQRDSRLSVEVNEVGSDGEEREEHIVDANIVGDMLLLKSLIDGWKQPSGISTVMLKITHGDEYMTGFATWYDKDTNQIESSRIAFAREGTHSFKAFLSKAERSVRNEADS